MDLKAPCKPPCKQLETEKGVSKDKIIMTIEDAPFSAAYMKDFGKKPDSPRQIQPGKPARCLSPKSNTWLTSQCSKRKKRVN